MALSSTEATPSITWPSSGIVSPASASTTMPLRSSSAPSGIHDEPCCGSSSFLPIVLRFIPRSDAACALLRPSASASAKFANNTVNHNQIVIARMNPGLVSPLPNNACTYNSVVMMLPM